jgi:hypothetical protein
MIPNFFSFLESLLKRSQPDLVVFGFQREPTSKTYFHSDFLPGRMPELGFKLVGRNKTFTGDIGLRLSVYARTFAPPKDSKGTPLPPVAKFDILDEKICNTTGGSKGAHAVYVSTPKGEIAFINAQMYHKGKIPLDKAAKDPVARQGDITPLNKCFNEMYLNLVKEAPINKPLVAIFPYQVWVQLF